MPVTSSNAEQALSLHRISLTGLLALEAGSYREGFDLQVTRDTFGHLVQTQNGPKRKYICGRKKKDMERRLAEAIGDVGTLTVGQWLGSWLSDCLKPLEDAGKMAHSTYIWYEGIVGNHLGLALGHRKRKDITRADVRRLDVEKGKTPSLRSVDYFHVTLQTALSRAVRDDLIFCNVAEGERARVVAASAAQTPPRRSRRSPPCAGSSRPR